MLFGLQWQLLAGMALTLLLSLGGGCIYGKVEHHRGVTAGVAQERAKAAAEIAGVKIAAQEVTVRTLTKYIPVVQTITKVGKTIIQKVPIYVTRKDDSACVVGGGFVSLWNGANTLQLSDATTAINDFPSAIVLSDIASEHAAEATLYATTAAQLTALQGWVKEEQATYQGK